MPNQGSLGNQGNQENGLCLESIGEKSGTLVNTVDNQEKFVSLLLQAVDFQMLEKKLAKNT